MIRHGLQRFVCSHGASWPLSAALPHTPRRRRCHGRRHAVEETASFTTGAAQTHATPSHAATSTPSSTYSSTLQQQQQWQQPQQQQQQQQQEPALEQALYVVGTPIGNLEDISFRALRILRGASLILAEDTRHTRKLLEHFSIRTPTMSCHQHNERQRQELVLRRLQAGESIALVSDAGMPAISDPGTQLVAAAVAAGCKVVPVPGPCAAITALAACGLPTDSFHFVGFLPPKSHGRCQALQQLASISATLVFYAPPHGLGPILADMVAVLGGSRRAVVARELTKLHEEFYRGPLADVLDEFGPSGRRNGVVKGEVVLLLEGCTADPNALLLAAAAAASSSDISTAGASASSAAASTAAAAAVPYAADTAAASTPADVDQALRQLLRQQLAAGVSVSASSKQLAKQFSLPRGRVYKLALALEQGRKAQQQQQ
ncbi:hypothetical protein OEZ86_001386 [Tetradesmus obliquus]|nr:hypothetical protein OEZ86_001386 [Tetradesmus obliquus]